MSIKSADFVVCPVCSRPVRPDRIEQHMSRVHPGVGAGDSKALASSGFADNAQRRNFIFCDICGANVLFGNLEKHQRKIHNKVFKPKAETEIARDKPSREEKSSDESKPIGVMVLEGLRTGQRYRASHSSRCEECKTKVSFLSVGPNKIKAFEVDRDRLILGGHACDGTKKSESIYAFSGGIIDSNRRKH